MQHSKAIVTRCCRQLGDVLSKSTQLQALLQHTCTGTSEQRSTSLRSTAEKYL
jgi:hypothetical protein